MLYYLAVAIYVICCLFLIVVVLLQPGKSGGKGGVFGAGSSTGSVFGGRGASTVMTRLTTGAAALFMILSIVLARSGLPTIRFLPDGSIGENSPQMLCLTSMDGGSLWLAQSRDGSNYEIRSTDK